MELVIKRLNPEAMKIGGVYRVVGTYNGVAINCLAVCVKADDKCGEYITIKDYKVCGFNCHGDIFRVDLTNYKDFTSFVKVKPNEIRCYPL